MIYQLVLYVVHVLYMLVYLSVHLIRREREGGRERGREGGRERGREGGREEGKEGERKEGGREGEKVCVYNPYNIEECCIKTVGGLGVTN